MTRGPAWPWFVNGIVCIVAFFVLRLVFDIPFWITAIAVVALSITGSILLTSASAPSMPEPGPTGDTAGPREEPFLLTEADLAEGKGVSGFKVEAGKSVGGGRFPLVPLLPGERIVAAVSGGHGGNFLRASLGYITLTDRRLIFTGEKPLFDPFFFIPAANLRALTISYLDVEGVDLQRRLNLGMQLGSLRPAVVVLTRDGRQHVFWPNVFDLEAFAARLR